MKKIEPGPTAWIIIITSAILIAANLLLGSVLVNNSRKSMTTLIQNRMLDISNTAADMLDGDVLDALKAEGICPSCLSPSVLRIPRRKRSSGAQGLACLSQRASWK